MSQAPSLASLSARLTTSQSQLLERTRVLSLGMVPSASSTTQLVRTLANVKKDLGKLSDEAELERAGLIVGGKGAKSSRDTDDKALEELEERYDRLVEMLAADEDGRERSRPLVREKRCVGVGVADNRVQSPLPQQEDEEDDDDEEHLEPSPPAQPLRPFKDYDDDDDGHGGEGDIMQQQHVMMNGESGGTS